MERLETEQSLKARVATLESLFIHSDIEFCGVLLQLRLVRGMSRLGGEAGPVFLGTVVAVTDLARTDVDTFLTSRRARFQMNESFGGLSSDVREVDVTNRGWWRGLWYSLSSRRGIPDRCIHWEGRVYSCWNMQLHTKD